MNPERLKGLRRKQLILTNLFFTPLSIITLAIAQWSMAYFYALFAVMLLIQYLKGRLYPMQSFSARLFPFMQELTEYEQRKWGDQWPKVTGRAATLNLVSAVLFGALAFMPRSSRPAEMPSEVLAAILLLMLFFVNVTMSSQIRKIDAVKLG